jgi:hypothetical protein
MPWLNILLVSVKHVANFSDDGDHTVKRKLLLYFQQKEP